MSIGLVYELDRSYLGEVLLWWIIALPDADKLVDSPSDLFRDVKAMLSCRMNPRGDTGGQLLEYGGYSNYGDPPDSRLALNLCIRSPPKPRNAKPGLGSRSRSRAATV